MLSRVTRQCFTPARVSLVRNFSGVRPAGASGKVVGDSTEQAREKAWVQKHEKEAAEEYLAKHPELKQQKQQQAASGASAPVSSATPQQKELVGLLAQYGVEVSHDADLVQALLKWKGAK